jgi:hypothetical protein
MVGAALVGLSVADAVPVPNAVAPLVAGKEHCVLTVQMIRCV